MPLWLDLLRTPMAAPETDPLRSMRRTFQLLCVASALGVLANPLLVALVGPIATFVTAVVLVMTALHTVLYMMRKKRADEAWLMQPVAEDEAR